MECQVLVEKTGGSKIKSRTYLPTMRSDWPQLFAELIIISKFWLSVSFWNWDFSSKKTLRRCLGGNRNLLGPRPEIGLIGENLGRFASNHFLRRNFFSPSRPSFQTMPMRFICVRQLAWKAVRVFFWTAINYHSFHLTNWKKPLITVIAE